MPAKIASSIAGRPSVVPGILMKRLGLPRALVQIARGGERAGGVVRQQRRDFERDPSVDAVGALEDRLEQIGRPGQIRQRQIEEQVLGRSCPRERLLSNVAVIVGAVLDRVIEDRGIRGEPGYRELVDVALQRAAVEQDRG